MEVTGQSAAARIERIIAIAVAVSRLVGLLYLPLIFFAHKGPASVRNAVSAALCVAALLEGCLLAGACWRVRTVRRWWIAADVAAGVSLLYAGSAFYLPRDGDVFYNYVLVTSVVIGLAPWSLLAASTAGLVLAGTAFIVDQWVLVVPSPLWQEIPNAVSLPMNGVIAWVVGWQLRRAAIRIDHYRTLAVASAAELASEQERARHIGMLRMRLLGTLERLAEGGTLNDSQVRAHVTGEAEWLRHLIEHGNVAPPGGLLGALQEICQDKARTGFTAELRVEEELPPAASLLSWERVEAVAGATREALTNVAKHAGVAAADIRIRAVAGDLTVEVVDQGRGLDLAGTHQGIGLVRSIRQRITDVGGRVEITSAPRQGTSVRLLIPLEDT